MNQCFTGAEILLPRFRNDPERMKKWACIACDQFTSENEYWEETDRIVGDAPSTLRMILRDLFLGKEDE